MLRFNCDYLEGAHPRILERLNELNFEKIAGYGLDYHSDEAKAKIRAKIGNEKAGVWFLQGGTQTNACVVATVLKPCEGVVAAETGHVAVHEAGAIEYTGHKVLTLPQHDGKVWASELRKMLETYYADATHEHMVKPGMLYISYPTEYGTLYTLEEMKQLHAICKEYRMPLYVDGARLGYGLAAADDMDIKTFAENCDIFYIGGCKNGTLFGEALVANDPDLLPNFFSITKLHGAMIAKGWVCSVQFDVLLSDGLWEEISKNAVDCAMKLKKKLIEAGGRPYIDSPTNQQFFILEEKKIAELQKNVVFDYCAPYDADHAIVRFVTSWATREDDLNALLALI
ncbi:MAG: aminotransferase class I/II-fold pyridoxal phosphate-dependent enzyme [Firmicutes bacterium]|nr:aminotransferase class I/II-fold pyridoxal phosphate-dependent enzyme [Bacillota bacterium]